VDFALTRTDRFKEAARESSAGSCPLRAEWTAGVRRYRAHQASRRAGILRPDDSQRSEGGLGGDDITYCIGMEEIGRAESPCAQSSVSTGCLGKRPVARFREQKQEWCQASRRTKRGCFALTSQTTARTGKPSRPGRTCRARLDHHQVQTIFITNGSWARSAWCSPAPEARAPGVSAFLVRPARQGSPDRDPRASSGLRGQVTPS